MELRREADARISKLDREVSAMRADISGLAAAMEHATTGMNELKALVLAEKSRPVNVTGWIGIVLSLLVGMFGAVAGFSNYVTLSQQPLEQQQDRLIQQDVRTMDRLIDSAKQDAASQMERKYLSKMVDDLQHRLNRVEERE